MRLRLVDVDMYLSSFIASSFSLTIENRTSCTLLVHGGFSPCFQYLAYFGLALCNYQMQNLRRITCTTEDMHDVSLTE